MKLYDKNLTLKKSNAKNQNNSSCPPIENSNYIKKLMKKFNISQEEAEKIFIELEENIEKNIVSHANPNNHDDLHNNKLSSNQNKKIINKSKKKNNLSLHQNSNNTKKDTKIKKIRNFLHNITDDGVSTQLKKTTKTENDFKLKEDVQHQNTENNIKESHDEIIKKNVNEKNTYENYKNELIDDILSDIIPEYNNHFSIEVNHVSLTFEITDDTIDTLKESFIRTIEGNKSKTIKFKALENITFKIYQGEKIGIIGYNGAGKSTLLNVISGIYTPDEGTVKTNGKISPLLALGAGFDYNYSGRNNILLNGAILGYDKNFLLNKMDEIIEFSELGKFIDIPIKNYSSGMLAKLGFSIATIVNPDILIIDEILGVGDVNFQKKSRDKIKSLMDGGTTVLLVSHSIPQIREICDKAIWIDKGKIREIGEVNKVCDHYLKDAEKASLDQLANIKFY